VRTLGEEWELEEQEYPFSLMCSFVAYELPVFSASVKKQSKRIPLISIFILISAK